MYQLKSSFEKSFYWQGIPFASIFFATNDKSLDDQDRFVIKQIALFLKGELAQGKTPELTLIGSSDHRGSTKLNQYLSDRRLEAVTSLLAHELHDEPRFKYVWAASVGELLDARINKGKHAKDKNSLAGHRVVLVHPGKHVLSGLREKRPDLFANLPRIKRYELGRGFVKATPPAEIMQELLFPTPDSPMDLKKGF